LCRHDEHPSVPSCIDACRFGVDAPAVHNQPRNRLLSDGAAIVLGVCAGLIFGASNVYLALKIGLSSKRVDPDWRCFHHDLPLASVALQFRKQHRADDRLRGGSVSAGSSHDPRALLMGYDLDISRLTILAIAGGLMGA